MDLVATPILGAVSDYVSWWQWILLVFLIGLLIFYWQYRKRQM